MGLVGAVGLDRGAAVAKIPSIGQYLSVRGSAGVGVEEDHVAWGGACNARVVCEGCKGMGPAHGLKAREDVQYEKCESGYCGSSSESSAIQDLDALRISASFLLLTGESLDWSPGRDLNS